ncbi:MAG: PQQ-binding-like beta-propeller repeat protein [Phycisphaerales bacterium]
MPLRPAAPRLAGRAGDAGHAGRAGHPGPAAPPASSFARTLTLAVGIGAAAILGPARVAPAQAMDTAVYVDASPRAGDLVLRAIEQSEENAGESLRLIQELLDESGDRLVPIDGRSADHFVEARTRCLNLLRRRPELLERHRLIEQDAAAELLAAGDLRRLVATRSLTTAGLEALMRLGQQAWESARFDEAIDHLQEAIDHPDATPRTQAAAWSMLGSSAHFARGRRWTSADAGAGYVQDLEAARAALAGLGRDGRNALGQVEALIADDPGADVQRGVGPFDQPGLDGIEDEPGETIWIATPTLGDARGSMRGPVAPNPDAPALALLTEDHVYVHTGTSIDALDRFTGASVWRSPHFWERDRQYDAADGIGLRGMAVDGDALVAITGSASTQRASISSTARLVCLDVQSGNRRWRTGLNRIGGDVEYEGLFPHGQPWIADGRVFSMARKLSGEKVLSSYIVALDLDTGRLEWIRHLASIGTRVPVTRPASTLAYERGRLYAATSVGAMACVDAPTGRIHWLVRTPVPPDLGIPARSFDIPGPLLTGDRVIGIRADRRAVDIRDRASGRLRRELPLGPATVLGEPAYLLTDGSRLFSVSSSVRCIEIDRPDGIIWEAPRPPLPEGEDPNAPMTMPARGLNFDGDRPDPARDLPIRPFEGRPVAELTRDLGIGPESDEDVTGRVLVAGAGLLIPTPVGVRLIDRETGQELERLDLGESGTPSAAGQQIVLARAGEVRSWMSLDLAERQLRQRIVGLPDALEPRLRLLQLALRMGRLDLVIEAARFSLTAVNAPSDEASRAAGRRQLFELLTSEDIGRLLGSDADAEAFFPLLAAVATSDDERVQAIFIEGDWWAGRNADRAIDVWRRTILGGSAMAARNAAALGLQDIPADVLALTGRVENERMRPAGAWAIERIGRTLNDDASPNVAEARRRFERQAREALALVPAADINGALDVARGWTFSAAGLAAARRVATPDVSPVAPFDAASTLIDLYRLAPTADRAATLLGDAIDMLIDDGRPAAARELAAEVATRHPGIVLQRQRQRTPTAQSPSAWIEALDAARAARATSDAADAPPTTDPLDEPDAAPETRVSPGADRTTTPPAPANDDPPLSLGMLGAAHAESTIDAAANASASGNAHRNVDLDRMAGRIAASAPGTRIGDAPRVLAARLVRPAPGPLAARVPGSPANLPLLIQGEAVVLLDPADLSPLWATAIDAPVIRVLDATDDDLLLWTGDQIGDEGMLMRPAIIALDRRDGTVIWRTPELEDLAPVRLRAGRVPTQLPDGRMFRPDEVIARCTADHVMLARRTGSIAGFERDLGDVAAWVTDSGLEEVHAIECGPFGVAVSGIRRRAGEPVGALVIIDPASGVVRHQVPAPGRESAAWLCLDGLGGVMAGYLRPPTLSDDRQPQIIDHVDMLSGGRRWANISDPARATTVGWRIGDRMLVRNTRNDVFAVAPDSGETSPTFRELPREEDPRVIHAVEAGGLLLRSSDRVMRLGPDGELLALDAIAERRNYDAVATADDGTLFVVSRAERIDRIGGPGGAVPSHVYRIYTLAADGMVDDDVVELPPIDGLVSHVARIPGWLMLDTRGGTIALPLTTGEPPAPPADLGFRFESE